MTRTGYTVLIDTRERRPLPIPSHITILNPQLLPAPDATLTVPITYRKAHLPTGDYSLDLPEPPLAERKVFPDEVTTNTLSADRPRFISQLDRLSEATPFPFLLLEAPSSTLFSCTSRSPNPAAAYSALLRLAIPRRVSLLLCPTSTSAQRRQAGYLLVLSLIESAMVVNPSLCPGS